MATSMTIIVLCPEGRRQKIKATPNTSILEVLEEACRKQGIKPEDYDICHYNRKLDLSLSLRFANIPNNAMLELNPAKHVRQEGSVTVCLQLESGDRVTNNFPPSASIWDIIQKSYCSQEQTMKEEPICIYMRQTILGEDIKKTTLRSLGLMSGKAIIRLMFREPNKLNEQAHVSLPITKAVPFKNEANDSSLRKSSFPPSNPNDTPPHDSSDIIKRIKTDSSNYDYSQNQSPQFVQSCSDEFMQVENSSDINANDSVQKTDSNVVNYSIQKTDLNVINNSIQKTDLNTISDTEAMDCENSEIKLEKEIGAIIYLGVRNAVLFNLEDISEVKKTDLPDDFFELTIDDVRYLMNELKNERVKMENAPLMLKSQREAQLFHQLACYKQTVLRIYFPDKFVLQGTFIADETVQAVYDFVRNFLEDKSLNFYLYITPPKTKLQLGHTLLEDRLVPAAVIYFGCDTPSTSYLLSEIKSQVSDPRAATLAASQCRKQKVPHSDQSMSIVPSSETVIEPVIVKNDAEDNGQRYVPPKGGSKAPKWFKFGKH